MIVLVANIGSTSFKYKLLDMARGGAVIARGGHERIGQPEGTFATQADAIDATLRDLPSRPDAVGFKAAHGGPIRGAVRVSDDVLATMQQFADITPAHNPQYIAAMTTIAARLPGVPQVACFETAFHQTIPMARQVYGIPWDWTERLAIRRYGFHGASHRYVAARLAELIGADAARRVVSCHLGGSCSVCAIEAGRSVYNSFGLTPQSGIFQNNRVGDIDVYALVRLQANGISTDEALKRMSREGGLLGISGVSNDLRDVESAANGGHERARLAIDAFVEAVRQQVGAALVALGGCDALAFTGGIGENAVAIREAIARNLGFAGIVLDRNKNQARGREEKISAVESGAQVWVVPTNEELIVARQTVDVLSQN